MSKVQYSGLFTRKERQHRWIDQATAFGQRTGLCPVCRKRRRAHGVTCGCRACVDGWLFPSKRFEEDEVVA